MASPVVTFVGAGSGGLKVYTADVTTTWIGGTLTPFTDSFVEGTQSMSEKVSGTTVTAYTVDTAALVGEPYNFSSGGEYEGNHIFAWIQALGTLDTLANGGVGIVIADDLGTDSVGTWYVGPQPGYLGGWVAYVINPAAPFDAVTAGTGGWTLSGNPAQLSGVDGFGPRWKITSTVMGASDNAMVDAISVGTGYRITNGDAGSTEGKFSDFVTFEENTTSGRFGALRGISGIVFPRCKLYIGAASGATNTEFIDSGFTVIWEKALLSDGASSAVASDFYALHVEKGSGTTDVTLSNGFLSSLSPHEVYIDFAGATSVNLTNVRVSRGRLIDLDSAVAWSGGTISDSGTLDLGGSPTLSDIQFLNPTDSVAMEVNATSEMDNVSNITFDGAGVGGLGSCAIRLNLGGGAGPFSVDFNNIQFQNRVSGSHDVLVPSDVVGNITINILNGGDTPTVNNQGSGTVTIVNAVNLEVTVLDKSDNGPVELAQVAIYQTSDNTELMNEDTATVGVPFVVGEHYRIVTVGTTDFTAIGASSNTPGVVFTATGAGSGTGTATNGKASQTFSFPGDTPIYVRVRKSSTGATKYIPFSTTGTIKSTGFTLTAVIEEDPNA